jgi:hypothetical protein
MFRNLFTVHVPVIIYSIISPSSSVPESVHCARACHHTQYYISFKCSGICSLRMCLSSYKVLYLLFQMFRNLLTAHGPVIIHSIISPSNVPESVHCACACHHMHYYFSFKCSGMCSLRMCQSSHIVLLHNRQHNEFLINKPVLPY